jgi:hypothetical protein
MPKAMRDLDDYRKKMHWRYVSQTPCNPTWKAHGRILVHNFPACENQHRGHGEGGFRLWTQDAGDPDLVACPCGWRPDLGAHYVWRDRKPSKAELAIWAKRRTRVAAAGLEWPMMASWVDWDRFDKTGKLNNQTEE